MPNPIRPNRPYRVHRPNILFIMSDQHRYDWFGAGGVSQVRTPNIDRLAEQGVSFRQATCNSPLCAPARAALATGLRPPRCHVLDNSYSLPLDQWTIYQHMRRYGYRTSLFGKLDLHKPQGYNGDGNLPVIQHLGFCDAVEAEGKEHGAHYWLVPDGSGGEEQLPLGPYQQHLLSKPGLMAAFHEDYQIRYTEHKQYAEPSVLPCEDFEDAWIGQRAVEYLRTVPDDAPFFQFVSFVGPHNPWDAPKEYLDRYLDVEMPAPVLDEGADRAAWVQAQQEEMSRGTNEATAQKMRQNYSGMVELIDDAIGEMLAVLEERGMLEDTIIVYTSDHGEMLGDLGLVHKSLPYEPAMRVPMILAGKGIPQMEASDALVELFDLTPTLCDLVGVPTPAELDARSLAPILRGEAEAIRDIQISTLPFFTAVRDGRWKAVVSPNDAPELYDLAADPHELVNVYDQYPEEWARLKAAEHHEVTGGMALL